MPRGKKVGEHRFPFPVFLPTVSHPLLAVQLLEGANGVGGVEREGDLATRLIPADVFHRALHCWGGGRSARGVGKSLGTPFPHRFGRDQV